MPKPFWDRGYRNFSFAIFILIVLYSGKAIFDAGENDLDFGGQGFLPLALSDRPKPGQNVAVVIENRPLDRIVPLLEHFSKVLGPEWPIYLFTTQKRLPEAPNFERLVWSRQIRVESLPNTVTFDTRKDVSQFLTRSWLYNKLAPAGHVLFFQTDSIICAQSLKHIEDYLQYDFIGAPINKKYGTGFNGGLSLRNREMFLDITRHSNWQDEFDRTLLKSQGDVEFEDQWFYKKLSERAGANLPTYEVASMFAVETIWNDRPLGYHQVGRFFKERAREIEAWCPESRLAWTDEIKEGESVLW